MTHPAAEAARPISVSMDGKATFTMLKSRTTMNDATRIEPNPRLRRRVIEAAWVPLGGWLGAPGGRLPRLLERDWLGWDWLGWDMAGVTDPAVGDSLTGAVVDIEPPFQYDTFRFSV